MIITKGRIYSRILKFCDGNLNVAFFKMKFIFFTKLFDIMEEIGKGNENLYY